MTFWSLWDGYGLNWLLFLLAFCLIEGAAIATGHRTLSASFWVGLSVRPWDIVLILVWQGLALVLFAHLAGGWGR